AAFRIPSFLRPWLVGAAHPACAAWKARKARGWHAAGLLSNGYRFRVGSPAARGVKTSWDERIRQPWHGLRPAHRLKDRGELQDRTLVRNHRELSRQIRTIG